MRRRFFVEQFAGNTAVIEGGTAHHLGHVLRAQKDQLYELSDGTAAWLGRIESVGRNRVEFALLEPLPAPALSVEVTLLLSIVKFDAFEWAIEKATELGVGTIIPLAAARSEKGLLAAAEKRSQRWQKILLEAAQQSRRLRLPVLEKLAKPGQSFAAQGDSFRVMLSEHADAPSIRKVLDGAKSSRAALAIGPEGGWTDEEMAAARGAGFHEVSLGQLILRTETAVVASLAMVNYALAAD
ncbi:MAG TPA: RsmE family RNA methyltransferase [Candidatus Acidoferrum sp.]|nr:RsmE family RNA methyltransferase [Candidatus Acidoferrum sp.]